MNWQASNHKTQLKSRFAVFSFGLLLWLLLVAGELSSLWFGLPCVLLIAGLLPLPPAATRRIQWRMLPGFIGFFLWQSLRSGVDLSWRILRGSQTLAPCQICYRLVGCDEQQRLLLIVTLNLMPGTLVTQVQDTQIRLHQIHPEVFQAEQMQLLQQRIASLLSPPIEEPA